MSNSKQINSSSKSVGAGLLVALTASLCCITPALATLAGIGGVAAAFSWMEPFRPYLIGFTVLFLGFAWYQKLKPRTKEEIECACEPARPAGGEDDKSSFWQSKKFLGIVTVFAVLMLAFPSYSHVFYPDRNNANVSPTAVNDKTHINKIVLNVKGMTCAGCESHINNAVGQLEGVQEAKASFKQGDVMVSYDPQVVKKNQVIEAINKTGYQVINKTNGN